MARLRLILAAALCMVCLGGYACGSTALGSQLAATAAHRSVAHRSPAHHKAVHRSTRAHRAPSCARQSSYRVRSRRHRRQRAVHCVRRRSSARHASGRRAKQHARARPPSHRPVKLGTHHAVRRAPRAPGTLDAANSSSCQNASLIPTDQNAEEVRAATLCLVNRERTANGVRPLQRDAALEQSAQSHTNSMAVNDYFEHVGPGGDTPASRMRASGYIYSSGVGYEIGENIGWGTLWLSTPRAIVAAWMASPGHRANILDPNFRDTGIGVSAHPPEALAHHQAGAVYTQDFGVIITG